MESSTAVTEEDDEVVDEVDVYLNTSLSTSLHVFQYWSRESPIAHHNHHDVTVKARPNHRLFEIETRLDTRGGNFDDRKSEQFGRYLAAIEARDEAKKGSSRSADLTPRRLDKQVLKSCEVRPSLPQYCVAVIRADCPEVHLNPIQSVIQFKPKLNYLDEKHGSDVIKPIKSGGSGGGDESEAELSSQDESEAQTAANIQTITMRFAGPDEDRKRKARESSFAYLQQTLARDAWVPIRCHPTDSQVSADSRLQLVYNALDSNNDSNADALNSTSVSSLQEFLTKLKCCEESVSVLQSLGGSQANIGSVKSESIASLSQISALPFADQVRHLLINAKLLSFDEIISLLKGSDFDAVSVLKSVQIYGLLVRGHWVVKSEILYNKDQRPHSSRTGIPIDLLCRTRDYIIWRFTQTTSLLKSDLFSSGWPRIPDEDVIDILGQFARRDPQTKLWSFAFADDLQFLAKHPEVAQRQQLLWSNRYASLERAYTSGTAIVKTEPEITATKSVPQSRKRRNSRKGSTASIASNTGEDKEVMDVMVDLEPICSPIKVKKERKSPVKTRKNSSTAALTVIPAQAAKERRRSKSPKVAVFEINPTPNQTLSADESKELVKHIYERLKNGFCLASAELRRLVADATGNKLCLSLGEEVMERAVREAGGFRVQNKWPQNSPQQPLYAMTKFGDPYDDFREALIEMFGDQTRVRVTAFTQKVRDRPLVCGGTGTVDKNYDNTCHKLLKDYCVLKAGLYYLKGTVSDH